jgi:hypothetical protein
MLPLCYRLTGLPALALLLVGCLAIDADSGKRRGQPGSASQSLPTEPRSGMSLSEGHAQDEASDEDGTGPDLERPQEPESGGGGVVPGSEVVLPRELPDLGPTMLQSSPAKVVMRNVQPVTFRAREVRLSVNGAHAVRLLSLELSGSSAFSLALRGMMGEERILRAGQLDHLPAETSLQPSESAVLRVIFSPVDERRHDAVLRVGWISEDRGETLEVPLVGNDAGPCLRVEPPVLSFGARRFGSDTELPLRLHSCGGETLRIGGFALSGAGSESFELVPGSLAVEGVSSPEWPAADAHLELPPGDSARLSLRYMPRAGRSPDYESGEQENAFLKVRALSLQDDVSVRLEGAGTFKDCPMAHIAMLAPELAEVQQMKVLRAGASGDLVTAVAPQTHFRLSGELSLPSAGHITEYVWEVRQPKGAASVFHPSASSPEVGFRANVAGRYTFRLRVRDAEEWSCLEAEREVEVLPEEAIHVELTWHTPADEDPTDEGQGAGSDMDLHFVHLDNALRNPHGEDLWPPPGNGQPEGYFDDLWDTFWFYVTHDWGRISVGEDDPSLDRDDEDGAGPENLNLHLAEEGVTYKIGVHYWNDHGFGRSTPCVRVIIFGTEVASVCGCPMVRYDMWEVGTLTWGERPFEVMSCATTLPPAAGEPWPERPCGTKHNSYPDGRPCDRVVIPSYEPQRFVFDF